MEQSEINRELVKGMLALSRAVIQTLSALPPEQHEIFKGRIEEFIGHMHKAAGIEQDNSNEQ